MAINIFTGLINSLATTAGNWSLSATPTSSDGNIATLNAISPNCNINTTLSCCGWDMTGYLGTLSGVSGASFSISGNCTFGGTITALSSLQFIENASVTSNGIAWAGSYSILSASALGKTITLNDPFVCNGSFSHISVNGTQTFNGSTFTLKGNWSQLVSKIISGTTRIILGGSGLQTISNTGTLSNDFDINSTGTINFSSTFNYAGGTFRYIQGIVDTMTANDLLTVSTNASTTTFYTSGITWDRVTFSNNENIVFMEPFYVGDTLTCGSSAIVFSGTAGFTTASFISNTGNLLFQNGLTYRVMTNMSITGLLSNTGEIKSNNLTGTPVNFILDYGATQDNSFVDVTNVDSSGGQTIYTRKGTLTNTNNWALLVPPTTTTSIF